MHSVSLLSFRSSNLIGNKQKGCEFYCCFPPRIANCEEEILACVQALEFRAVLETNLPHSFSYGATTNLDNCYRLPADNPCKMIRPYAPNHKLLELKRNNLEGNLFFKLDIYLPLGSARFVASAPILVL